MKIETFTIPKQNKEIFIKPAYEDIPGLISLNKERFKSYDFDINSIPFSGFREQVRSETLKKAGEYTEKIWSLCSNLNISSTEKLSCINDSYAPDKDITETGHSPILAHPGVLIKHGLINSIAKKVNGIGVNMIVDNDACHDNCLSIPDINGMDSSVERIEFLSSLYNLAFEEIKFFRGLETQSCEPMRRAFLAELHPLFLLHVRLVGMLGIFRIDLDQNDAGRGFQIGSQNVEVGLPVLNVVQHVMEKGHIHIPRG